ncbi:MAG TPA: alpha/beta hydrolase [Gemmatimonadales bacterium]|jgi:pimeloyl-ACP methyl ester carboxylesterase
MSYAPVNGLQLYYEVHGEPRPGRVPLVLIHGGGSSIHVTWDVVIPLLARNRMVMAFDEQGHGRTRAIDRPFTFENSAADAAALLDYLRVERADVMGFSNGGSIALRLGLRHPDKVRKLVVISTQYRRDGMVAGFWDGFQDARLEMMPKSLRDFDLQMNDPQHLQQMFDQDLKRMAGFQDWPDEDLTRIAAPTLVMVGDRDVVTIEHAVRMSKLISAAQLLVVPGSHGEFLGQLEVRRPGSPIPAAVMNLVEAFLDE